MAHSLLGAEEVVTTALPQPDGGWGRNIMRPDSAFRPGLSRQAKLDWRL